jgi:NAD(P)-dependent dehydrogenase (short-subunit alcohol dehydrogenase family)
MRNLEGKTAIVTGANFAGGGENIGGATARLLAERGAHVLVADLPGRGSKELADRLTKDGLSATSFEVDLREEQQIVAMIDAAVGVFGRLDVLHNNAGVVPTSDQDVVTMSAETWDLVFSVDVRGSMLAAKHAIPHMVAGGGGSIINTSSVAAVAGDVIHTAYGSAKAALSALTQYIATQYGARGVRCNVICPGLTMSPAAYRDLPEQVVESMLELTPFTRLATPLDQARVVAFLASDESAMVNGQTLRTDGGALSVLPWVTAFVNQGSPAYGNA